MTQLTRLLFVALTMTTSYADEHPIQSHTQQIAGASIHYLEGGPPDGLPVLFLHGAAFHSGTWQELGSLDTLRVHGYRTVAIDLPGYGLSEPSEHAPLKFMEAVLDTLHLDRPVVLSPSMSGSFSFPLATQRPDRLRGYVPIAPVGIARYSSKFKQITVPTFIIWGTHDNVIPFDQAFALERGIPDSEILILEGARHPCYLDDPEIFHKGLLYFLEKLKENGD